MKAGLRFALLTVIASGCVSGVSTTGTAQGSGSGQAGATGSGPHPSATGATGAAASGTGPRSSSTSGSAATTGTVATATSGTGSTSGVAGTACAAIANFRTTTISTSTVGLAWTGAPGVTFTVSSKPYCNTTPYAVLATLPAGTTTYTDSTVNADWVYWYELTATDGQGNTASVAIGAAAAAGEALGCSGASPQPSGVTDSCSATSTTGSTTSSAATTSSSGTTTGGALGATHSVLEYHNDPARDGVYVDSAFTKANISQLSLDPNFTSPSLNGQVYSQLVYADDGANGARTLFLGTENDQVYAIDAQSGALIWNVQVGTPIPTSAMPCTNVSGNIGISGTPAIDLASRTLVVAAMNYSAGAARQTIQGLSLDTGVNLWTVYPDNLDSSFDSLYQNQRGAVMVLNGWAYVPYGGNGGDCGTYYGRIFGVPLSNPSGAIQWSTPGQGSLWHVSGLNSDGVSIYATTGNSDSRPSTWTDAYSEAVLRLSLAPQLSFTLNTNAYFTPANWQSLDASDGDLDSGGFVLFTLSGAGSGNLGLVIGKTQTAYLLDLANLGGQAGELANLGGVASDSAYGSMASYTTPKGTYVAYRATCGNGNLGSLQILPGSPPTISQAFCVNQGGSGQWGGGSPIVTTSDGTNDYMVWGLGAGNGDQTLRAFDADTGTLLFTSAALNDTVERWLTPIVTNGHLYVAGDNKVWALKP